MPSFFPFLCFFFHIDLQIRNKSKWFVIKVFFLCITIVNMGDFITRNPAETRSCGSAEETDCKKLLLETLETDKNNVEIPLRTQTTTRQRYDEIKKKKGKVGNNDVLAFVQSRRDSVWTAGFGDGGT